jgi:RIO-like serine/threonine protein kinase
VWRDGDWVYKKQPKFLADNEIWCYEQMADTGFVPVAERVDETTIRTMFVETTPITDVISFALSGAELLAAMWERGIIHGDLTIYSVIPHYNVPTVIDWAESRLVYDPRPAKRPEGDKFWLMKTMRELLDASLQ